MIKSNLYNKMGSREICNAIFRAKSAMKFGTMTFEKGEPIIMLDTCKTSSLDGDATTVYANGGRGNNKLIAWEGDKTVTYTIEDALISPMSMSILTGASISEATDSNIIHVSQYVNVVAEYSEGKLAVDLTDSLDGEVLCTTQGIYGYVLNSNGSPIAKLGKASVSGNTVTFDAPAGYTENYNVTVYYYIIKRSGVTSIEISPDKFAGYFYLEAETLYRDEATTQDIACVITIPKVKIQSKFSFSMSASGDPSSFSFTMDAFPDYTLFNKSKKVLATMEYVHEIEDIAIEAESIHTHTVGDFVGFEFNSTPVTMESGKITANFIQYVAGTVAATVKRSGSVIKTVPADSSVEVSTSASLEIDLNELDNGVTAAIAADDVLTVTLTHGDGTVITTEYTVKAADLLTESE